jgi:hypothetical protein
MRNVLSAGVLGACMLLFVVLVILAVSVRWWVMMIGSCVFGSGLLLVDGG